MCDYSLHLVVSRPARVGDKLISTSFPHTTTRGFASVDDRNVAVCLLPGTELAFEAPSPMASIVGPRTKLSRLRPVGPSAPREWPIGTPRAACSSPVALYRAEAR